MSKEQLKIKQSYPLDIKIELTKQALREFIGMYGVEGVYVAFSGGKDSTVLLDILRKNYTDQIPAIFSNTKNEFESIIEQVRYSQVKYKNVQIVMSEKNIEDVVKEHGYPVVSKKVSRMLRDIKNPTDRNETTRTLYLTGIKADGTKTNHFKLPLKYRYLIDSSFKISEKCCDELKKKPMKKYEKETGRKPIIATLANESSMREQSYLKHGCNNFNKGASTPMAFWTEQDVLQYIVLNDLKIASVYGEIKQGDDGLYYTTGETRTGCVACLLGMEQDKDRILRLKEIEPKKYDYVVNRLGFKDILDYMNYKY